ncbi:hypothetical protein LZZ85_22710 [Terrimonas sp. NA20]|uniref:Lipoprotein n=1 Tax=Terrimonas ginsenosidimutans TaxID=2908004 RepID=A0ABS9KXT2_9BACT|nr:hypothetical protein [Terrimonas ginsenosidimutans]MCG2617125.1 hypothetical protein [Terrimonas ginsenosidimutans]
MQRKIFLFLLACCAMFLTNCSKSDLNLNRQLEVQSKQKAEDWLETKGVGAGPLRLGRISAIKESLIFEKASVEKLEDGESLYIIPLSSSFKMINKSDKVLDHYLLLFENSKGVYKGNIMQVESSTKSLPRGTLGKVWDCNDVNVDGTFSLLTIFDKLLYEVKFAGGKKVSFGEVKSKGNRDQSGEVSTQNTSCTDWYLVTTTFYDDGTTTTTEQYLGTTCTTLCPNGVCNEGLPGGGDGGGEDPDPEIQVSTDYTWKVYEDSILPEWRVYSTDKIKAKKRASLPNGGHFTSIEHVRTVGPKSDINYYWWKVLNVYSAIENNGQDGGILVLGYQMGHIFPKEILKEEEIIFTEIF